jgi:hypothetical protein
MQTSDIAAQRPTGPNSVTSEFAMWPPRFFWGGTVDNEADVPAPISTTAIVIVNRMTLRELETVYLCGLAQKLLREHDRRHANGVLWDQDLVC